MTAEFLKDYLPIILFLIIALGLSCAFIAVNFILSPKNPGFFGDKIKFITINAQLKPKAITKKSIIGK